MAVVAVDAVVDVALYALVIGVGLRLLVTVGAGEYGVIVWIGVARGAHAVSTAMVRVPHGVVLQRQISWDPGGGVVARVAGGRPPCGCMHWVIGRVPVRHMARRAQSVRRGQAVVVVDVALTARNAGVETCQRPAGGCVIKGAIHPVDRVVAHLAARRESGGSVRRIICHVVVGLVARDAGRVRQLVVVVHMALIALRAGQVEAGQRPARGRVIKFAICPEHRVVAQFTSGREARCHVINRRGRGVVIRHVAA